MIPFTNWLLLVSGLALMQLNSALAQSSYDCIPPANFPRKPQLVGGGGSDAVIAAMERQLHYPPRALRDRMEGRVFIKIDILSSGEARNVTVIKSLRSDCDSAAVRAVQRLPRFEARPNHTDTVHYYLPVRFKLPAAQLRTSSSSVVALQAGPIIDPAERGPELLGGGSGAAIVAAVQQRLVYPPQAKRARAEGRVFVGFTITPQGLVKDAHIWRGFRPDCDAAALQAVRKLPRFKPCLQFSKPVACGYTVPVMFRLSPKPQPTK
jgi:TonB family protein